VGESGREERVVVGYIGERGRDGWVEGFFCRCRGVCGGVG
jgi:hypothetical protein